MRVLILALLMLPLAACAGGPQALGITGPDGGRGAAPVAAPEPSTNPFENPDTMQSGERYGPSSAPTTGGGHFWGYD
jgi:hypothetical protein